MIEDISAKYFAVTGFDAFANVIVTVQILYFHEKSYFGGMTAFHIRKVKIGSVID